LEESPIEVLASPTTINETNIHTLLVNCITCIVIRIIDVALNALDEPKASYAIDSRKVKTKLGLPSPYVVVPSF
jgi:hypothetical protein